MSAFGVATAFWVSYVLLWCLVALLVLLVVLLYRQFGLTFMHPDQRVAMQGLDVGAKAPAFRLTTRSGLKRRVAFEAGKDGGRATVLLFAQPGCGICADLAESLVSLPAERQDVQFVWVDGSSPRPPRRAIEGAPGWISGSESDDPVHRQWDVSAVPFCFVVAPNGRIADKRLVNRRQDIEAGLAALAAPPLSAETTVTIQERIS